MGYTTELAAFEIEVRREARALGWWAREFGLPHTASAEEVLEADRSRRAVASGLAQNAAWYEIFLSDLTSGRQPELPSYDPLALGIAGVRGELLRRAGKLLLTQP